MANKMLIDASHPEETRVVVLRGNRVEEFDFESANKKQLRGNIYLAKVTRVEPSLQAAFVDYGGNRHGFLAFSEIHPDYYQIPVADRQALIEEEALAQRDEEEEDARASRRSRRFRRNDRNGQRAEKRRAGDETLAESYESEGEGPLQPSLFTEGTEPRDLAGVGEEERAEGERAEAEPAEREGEFRNQDLAETSPEATEPSALELRAENETSAEPAQEFGLVAETEAAAGEEEPAAQLAPQMIDENREAAAKTAEGANGTEQTAVEAPFVEAIRHEETLQEILGGEAIGNETLSAATDIVATLGDEVRRDVEDRSPADDDSDANDEGEDEEEVVEQLGGDAMEEVPSRPNRYRRQYKIQEVIKRRQVLLVQVVKEERGNKGAALTTYLSLAGRYSVLMPNTARGGGISRKITDAADRQRLKSIAQELEVPEGMGVILRTAGASRTKAEVKRDFEYLLRMWETVREMTLRSTAPTLVYEEGSLIKRAIRDLYNKDIDEIIVSGENGYREAKEFMRMLMPSHAKAVQPYRDPQPIFAKAGAEAQLDAMFSNQVTLKSGGYLVINQAEALVAIDVNSGRSTREHNIEDTAVRTNLEAADEVARQLRLRDLAGLIVVDFIDMEESRNNRAVERRLKEALKNDRARIQVGRISHFGLLEMSRQRMRTGVLEGSTVPCPHCAGAGMVRSTASIALHVLRVLEDALIKNAAYDVIVNTRTVVALYILNQKRVHLRELEQRFGVSVTVAADDSLTGTTYHALERGELASGVREIPVRSEAVGPADFYIVEQEEDIETEEEDLDTSESMGDEAEARQAGTDMEGEGDGEGDGARRRRRRRRRRGGRGADREGSGISANAPQPSDDALGFMATMAAQPGASTESEDEEADEAAVSLAPEEAETEANGPRKRSRKSGRAPREMAPSADESEAAQAQDVELEIETEQEVEIEAVAEDMQPAQGRRPRRVRSRGPRRPAADLETEAKESEARPEASPVEVISDVSPGEPPAGIVFPVTGDEVWPVPAPQALPESAQVPILATAEADSRHAPVEEQTHIPAEALVPAAPAPVPAAEPDPARPKRSGWWQRAKATLRG